LGSSYIVLNSDNPVKVSAFEVILTYTNATSIQSVNMVNPFTSFSNIGTEKERVKVVGLVESPEIPYLPTTFNPLAEIVFTGENKFNITVEVLEDFDRKSIPVNNFVIAASTITPPDPLSPYNLEPVRQSPIMEVIVIKPPVEQVGPTILSFPSNGSVVSIQTASPRVLEGSAGSATSSDTGNVTPGIMDQPIPGDQITRESGQVALTSGKGASAGLPLPIILFAVSLGCIVYVLMKKME
jgi:hypothetical protein